MASSNSAQPLAIAADDRMREKDDSRRADVHALVTREKTFTELRHENTPITLSGERIDFSRSTSDLW
jgi:hypothetical protein